eukprot:scaffold2708_cov158-Ochromonas_danica.AAC.1
MQEEIVRQNSQSSQDDGDGPRAVNCIICAHPAEYECFPCRCNVYCKKCAMKLATGGKCKKCKNLFASMAHIGQCPAVEDS